MLMCIGGCKEAIHMGGGHKYFRQQIEFFNNACQIKLNELHVPMRHAVNGGEVGS